MKALAANRDIAELSATFADDELTAAALSLRAHWSGVPFDAAVLVDPACCGDGLPVLPWTDTIPAAVLVEKGEHELARAVGFANYLVALVPRTSAELAALVARLSQPRPHLAAVARLSERHGLSLAQFILLQDTVDGFRAKEISDHLRVAASTIASHWSAIFAKTNLGSQAEVLCAIIRDEAARAAKHGAKP